jgi:hypothetical protein
LLYTTLVIWFAEGVHASTIATPPIRPWYLHKRGFAFSDVLRAAQRAMVGTDVLDRACYSANFHQLTRLRENPDEVALEHAA